MVILTPILLGLVWITGRQAFGPVLDQADIANVKKMDSALALLHNDLETRGMARGDKFITTKGCAELKSSWQSTGEYLCTSTTSTETLVSLPEQATNAHENYFSIVNMQGRFTDTGPQKNYPNNQFGKSRVVSYIEQAYKEVDTDAACSYSAQILQAPAYKGALLNEPGASITTSEMRLRISFTCSLRTRGDWL